jgi:predicted acetyltransferase
MTSFAIRSTVRKTKMPEAVSHDGAGWPVPPEPLSFGEVSLRFVRIFPGDEARGFVPFYHFRILNVEGVDIGRINFRVGDTKHVLLCAGHIGYEISEPHRGHGFARQACRALAPFVRSIYETVIITCDPDNIASTRTIERLGADYLDEVPVAPEEPAYERGSRSKKRFQWKP